MARYTGRSYRARNSISWRRPVSARKASDSSFVLWAVMPLMHRRRSGSCSMTIRVSVPKRSTSR